MADVLLQGLGDQLTFDPASAQGGIGLVGMTERVFAFAGKIDVRSAPGQGTRVEVVLPVARTEPDAPA